MAYRDPLIYYAKNAWYIRTTSFRDRMVALNKSIDWVPANIRDGRFGNWLENNVIGRCRVNDSGHAATVVD